MRVFLKHSIHDIRRSFRKVLIFEALYFLLTGLLVVPAIAFAFNRILLAVGANVLMNRDVYRIALTYEGMVGLATIAFLFGIILFLELGTVLVLVQKRLFRRDMLISDAFVTAMSAVPKLLGLGFVQLLFLFLVFTPFLDSPLTAWLLGNVNLPILLVNYLYDSKLWLLLYTVVVVAAAYLFLRWIFALHFILIEGQSTRQAMRSSFRLTRTRKGVLIVHLLLMNVLLYGAAIGLLSSVSFVLKSVDFPFVKFVVTDFYATLSAMVTYLFTMLVIPVNLIVLTRLFYVFRRANGMPFEDRLPIVRSRWLRRLEVRLVSYFRNRGVRKTLVVLGLVYLSGVLAVNHSIGGRLVYLDWNVKVAAHRGDIQSAPENSLSAIRAAIEKQVDAVEIDVQLTKDGVVVLNHDYTLERVGGVKMSVHDLTMADIASIELRGPWTGRTAERIPTLAEALREIKGKAQAIVEIKPYGDKPELARKVADLIAAEGMTGEAYVQSFDYGVLRTVREANPDLKLGIILFAAAGNIESLDVDFYTISQNILSNRFIGRAHGQGREVWVWTVNIERNMREALRYDIDGLITDYPEKVQRLVGVE
ncbi:glycerophosphoryl diester phosphodiesterase membrane domain-containing protein [Paenibacillus sp. TRM 82003]|nr:glycerophosphoryl diester phosphodiesterase membrane domain-containing protein [Paenibacillus sp. TRM 82003]